jgi:uncharacterized membrane protein YfcA
VNIRELWPKPLASLIGSIFGALLATVLPVDIMRAALPMLLIAIAIYFAVKPSLGDVDPRASHRSISVWRYNCPADRLL